jgi:hypothetical protein
VSVSVTTKARHDEHAINASYKSSALAFVLKKGSENLPPQEAYAGCPRTAKLFSCAFQGR